jgi:hypothetical protein
MHQQGGGDIYNFEQVGEHIQLFRRLLDQCGLHGLSGLGSLHQVSLSAYFNYFIDKLFYSFTSSEYIPRTVRLQHDKIKIFRIVENMLGVFWYTVLEQKSYIWLAHPYNAGRGSGNQARISISKCSSIVQTTRRVTL